MWFGFEGKILPTELIFFFRGLSLRRGISTAIHNNDMFGSQKGESETGGLYQSQHKLGSLSLPHLLSCHKIERESRMKKVTYLLVCVFKPQTPTPVTVLFVNLLIDFDASVPIDQTEPRSLQSAHWLMDGPSQ
jgi:hypothetical protein